MKECNWKEKISEVDCKIKTIILDHLQLLIENFSRDFPESLCQNSVNEIGIINPYIADRLKQANLGELMETLMKFQPDFSERASL